MMMMMCQTLLKAIYQRKRNHNVAIQILNLNYVLAFAISQFISQNNQNLKKWTFSLEEH